MPQNIFGTDGVRGVANADLSCDLAFRLGRAATKFLGPDICIGRDTRLSGTMLESALTAGIMAEGGRPHCCGVIPTPAVALLTVQNELDGGIVISASHNPPEFNGIKFFSRKGMKLPDAVEEEISAWVMSEEAMAADTLPTGAGVGHIIKMKDARKAYVDHAIDTLDGLRLDGLVVAVDCGHGASCQTTPAALQRLGATVLPSTPITAAPTSMSSAALRTSSLCASSCCAPMLTSVWPTTATPTAYCSWTVRAMRSTVTTSWLSAVLTSPPAASSPTPRSSRPSCATWASPSL